MNNRRKHEVTRHIKYHLSEYISSGKNRGSSKVQKTKDNLDRISATKPIQVPLKEKNAWESANEL